MRGYRRKPHAALVSTPLPIAALLASLSAFCLGHHCA